MSKLESVIEFVIDIGNFSFATEFFNGYYNVRVRPKLQKQHRSLFYYEVVLLYTEDAQRYAFPAGTWSGAAVSKTRFLTTQERNCHFGDVFSFKLHFLENLHQLRSMLSDFKFTFMVELFRSPLPKRANFFENFVVLSSRTMDFTFDPTRGFFLHVPLLMCFTPLSLLNLTVFSFLVYICPPTARLAKFCSRPCGFEDILYPLRKKCQRKGSQIPAGKMRHREMCYLLLTTLNCLQDLALRTSHLLSPSDTDGLGGIDVSGTFADLMNASAAIQSDDVFTTYARESVVKLCCFNALLWEAFLLLARGRDRLKYVLCTEYFRKKAEHYQELCFARDRDRCASVSPEQGCKTGAYRYIAKAIRTTNYAAVVPPPEVYCREVDECPKRPVVVFEENYSKFSDLCPLCGFAQYEGFSVPELHKLVASLKRDGTIHRSVADTSECAFTPMLFAVTGSKGNVIAPPRIIPVEKDTAAFKKNACRFQKIRLELQQSSYTNWTMSEPEFLSLADHCMVFQQIHRGRALYQEEYASEEPLHFVVFVHGLGGKGTDFFWAKRWIKLLIPTRKHVLIWSEANEEDKSYDEIAACGERLAREVAVYLDHIGTRDFKLSFVGFSLGCVLVRAALTCPQMRPYITNLHTFVSVNGPHLGLPYVKSKFLRFFLSLLSRIRMRSSVKQLAFQDSADIRRSYLYILSRAPGLEYFKNVLLMGSSEDKLVPVHTANIQHCSESLDDKTVKGKAYEEMMENLLGPLLKREDVTLKRYDVFYDMGMWRYLDTVFLGLSHVGALVSRNFFEKFMLVSGARSFN